jgi:hypothetical protein
MIFSVAVVASVLSLLCSARALTLPTRQNDCSFVCPGTDVDGKGLSAHTGGDTTISCSYSPESGNWCTYASVSVGPLCVSHTPAHMSRLRTPALSWMGVTAVLNRLRNYAPTAEADSWSRRLCAGRSTTGTRTRGNQLRVPSSIGNTADPQPRTPYLPLPGSSVQIQGPLRLHPPAHLPRSVDHSRSVTSALRRIWRGTRRRVRRFATLLCTATTLRQAASTARCVET